MKSTVTWPFDCHYVISYRWSVDTVNSYLLRLPRMFFGKRSEAAAANKTAKSPASQDTDTPLLPSSQRSQMVPLFCRRRGMIRKAPPRGQLLHRSKTFEVEPNNFWYCMLVVKNGNGNCNERVEHVGLVITGRRMSWMPLSCIECWEIYVGNIIKIYPHFVRVLSMVTTAQFTHNSFGMQWNFGGGERKRKFLRSYLAVTIFVRLFWGVGRIWMAAPQQPPGSMVTGRKQNEIQCVCFTISFQFLSVGFVVVINAIVVKSKRFGVTI